jgi:hypothetical protein
MAVGVKKENPSKMCCKLKRRPNLTLETGFKKEVQICMKENRTWYSLNQTAMQDKKINCKIIKKRKVPSLHQTSPMS